MKQSRIMEGKKGLVMGLVNQRSIAYGISKFLYEEGAKIAFSVQNEMLKNKLSWIRDDFKTENMFECDVSDESEIKNMFANVEKCFGKIDFIIHSLAFSDKDELSGEYVDTTKQNFLKTMDISCYSFTSVARHAKKILNKGASLLTLSYYGAEKALPNYNVMGVAKAALEASVKYLAVDLGQYGVRVNAISAGPLKTLAASGISDFRYIFKWNEANAPLRRNIDINDVGKAGLFLISDLSSGVTGEIMHVDCGYNVIGMKNVNAPDITIDK